MCGRVEGDDDRRLHLGSQEGSQPQPAHSLDQRATVVRITRRGQPALLAVLRERLVQRDHHMRRRREALLRGLLHVGPLVMQVHGQRGGSFRPRLQRSPRTINEAYAEGTPSRHFPRPRSPAMASNAGRCRSRRSSSHRRQAAPGVRPRRRSRGSGLRMPVPVSQCTCATCVMAGSAARASIATGSAGNPRRRTARRPRDRDSRGCGRCGRNTHRYWVPAPCPRGTGVPSAASTAKVPEPCRHADVRAGAMDDVHELPAQLAGDAVEGRIPRPQSCSMACLVRSEVVSGPGSAATDRDRSEYMK